MIEIQKGVPLPARKRGAHRGEITKALLSMDVGDSIFILKKAGYWCVTYAKSVDPTRKFASRSEGEGRRIWRLE